MDIAFEAVGSQGKFQRMLLLLAFLVTFLVNMSSSLLPLLAKKPDFLCKEKNTEKNSYKECLENDLCKNEFFKYEKNEATSFKNWAYDFELYCEKSYISPVISSFYFFGGIIGSVFLSPLPDKYGRKEIFNIILIALFVLQLNVFFAINEWHLLLTNFLLGITSYAFSLCVLLITELFDRENAATMISFVAATYPLSGIIGTLFLTCFNNWRALFFVMSAVAFLCVLIGRKYLQESPRWLNSKNRFVETLAVFKEIARINDSEENFNKFLSVNSILIQKTTNTLKEIKKSYNIYEVFKFKSQQKPLALISFIFFSYSFCFYGLIMNLEHISGDIVTNSIVIFTGELISEIISGYLADKYGRLIVMQTAGFIGGMGFLFHEFSSNKTFKKLLVFLISLGFSANFNIIFIYAPEVFPTTVRSTVYGFLCFIGKFGAFTVPSISALVPRVQFLFALLAIVSSCLCFLLKETLGSQMQDDIPEVKRRKSFLSVSDTAARRISLNCLRKMSINKQLLCDSLLKVDPLDYN